jgi:hypothetical protein
MKDPIDDWDPGVYARTPNGIGDCADRFILTDYASRQLVPSCQPLALPSIIR